MRRVAVLATGFMAMSGFGVVSASATTIPDCLNLGTFEAALPTVVGTEGPDVLRGTDGPDVILGLGGDDRIFGLGGDDVICGGLGADQVDGGPGNDSIAGDRPCPSTRQPRRNEHAWRP